MKTFLVGMNNPDPDDAFNPARSRTSGGRLLKFVNAYLTEELEISPMVADRFLSGFERINVLDQMNYDQKAAKAHGPIVLKKLRNRRAIIFGLQTVDALGLRRPEFGEWINQDEVEYTVLPHPSGRNRFYNVNTAQHLAGRTMVNELLRYFLDGD